ncbi:MAG TPA: radical SAM protein [Rhodospirillales bacterium]|nr:radical SAM protein [Rhodospirillales bacterium]
MPDTGLDRLSSTPRKFVDPDVTATGEIRASVTLVRLRTLWFNTGSLCNIACKGCYIESSPRNDRLAYLSAAEVSGYLDEVAQHALPVQEVGFTGGEPFLNREFPQMLGHALARGFRVLVLTNAMKPMQRRATALLDLRRRHGSALTMRVSVDHFLPERHESVRGRGTWAKTITGLRWLCANGFRVDVAGRTVWGEAESAMRAGFARLFAAEGLPIDAADPRRLVLFPEMDPRTDVPEISTRCWTILGVRPDDMMCASSRMIVKRKGAPRPAVVPCTLLPYDPQFELGHRLAEASTTVRLNHPFCAQFCVLGGASCSAG